MQNTIVNENDKAPNKAPRKKYLSRSDLKNTYLIESAWEVCNQVGGIYTVIRSKVPATIARWENYCLLGPYVHPNVSAVFDPTNDYNTPVGAVIQALRKEGFDIHYGHWLITGRPTVVLFNPHSIRNQLNDIKYRIWHDHQISFDNIDPMVDDVVAFSWMAYRFIEKLAQSKNRPPNIIAHFHEWMSGLTIPLLRQRQLKLTTVFTTHASLLGRYLAMNDSRFYHNLPYFDWLEQATHFNILTQVKIERAAAHGAHVFTTVSQVTGQECKHLIGREPEVILPNGLNISRFKVMHEFQNLHKQNKEKINHFVMGHFFPSYSFDLDKTLYFFTAGRYEFRNKGFDMVLESLAQLNWRLKESKSDITVVVFVITQRPFRSINARVLQTRAVMEEINQTCRAIRNQIGERLFYASASSQSHKLPVLNDMVDDYWKLRLRRTIQSWKSTELPSVITHDLEDDHKDEILDFIRGANLINFQHDRVKIVYHPDFISPTNPLFGMEYAQFIRGCHLGIFPSYYEPWGYTPLECLASGIPAITSNLSGFGHYCMKNIPDLEKRGIGVIDRQRDGFQQASHRLSKLLFIFSQMSRRQRISQRNRVDHHSVEFDWKNLVNHYNKAYQLALQRI